MSFKLKLNTSRPALDGEDAASERASSIPPTPASTTSTGGGFRLSLKKSVPPTPVSEQPPPLAASAPKTKKAAAAAATQPKARKLTASKKRQANDDTISPAAKRLAGPSRKISLKIGHAAAANLESAPQSARITLKRKPTGPKLRAINARKPPPPRLPGQGYDSEDSEAEDDPALQQAFVLRMQPGSDCDYLHDAIANGRVGLPISEGGAEVSFRFIEKENRRAVVTVRGTMYAAALVDLPCIVETMKSWDKKGWWKVADMSQMLLVLGKCTNDDEARSYPLPREVDNSNMQYAHGLTPPMHWVRKRRFRKRLSYKTIANVDEEVERLLHEDEQVEKHGGTVKFEIVDPNRRERITESAGLEEEEYEDEPDALETIENGQQEEYMENDEDFAAELEGGLQAAFDEEFTASTPTALVTDIISDSPAPVLDQVITAQALTADPEDVVATPIGHEPVPQTSDDAEDDDDAEDASESSGDDDDDEEDEDSPSAMDEDAAAKAAERAQQLEEVADLEREIANQKHKCDNMNNALLKQRALAQLRVLEEDLRVKKGVFGIDEDDDEDPDAVEPAV